MRFYMISLAESAVIELADNAFFKLPAQIDVDSELGVSSSAGDRRGGQR